MNGFEKYRRIKLAKSRKLYKKHHPMTEDLLIKRNELSRKIAFIDRYKLAYINDMIDACKMADKTKAKIVVNCYGIQISLTSEQSVEALKEMHRLVTQERQQLIKELEDL